MDKSDDWLRSLEDPHRCAVGKGNFCYSPVLFRDGVNLWRLGIVREGQPGYYPVSEDCFMGTEGECTDRARVLNRDRLKLSPDRVAVILGSSMFPRP